MCYLACVQDGIGADVPRRKRDKPSRLSRNTATGDPAKGKSKVDRFHYLFEAIEADKASDSETGNEAGSSQGAAAGAGQADDAQEPSSAPEHTQAGELPCVSGLCVVRSCLLLTVQCVCIVEVCRVDTWETHSGW